MHALRGSRHLYEFPNPTTLRLSEHFLLSDFLGCDAVYRHGLANLFHDPDGSKLREGKALCAHVLEPLLARSRLSISYGYISPEVSHAIVKYQDPNKPSYHRWDAGAACDVVLHESQEAPILDAIWMDDNLPMSRTITYSESPFICVGVRAAEIEKGDPRRALYENRYIQGEAKPQYIPFASTPARRIQQKKESTAWAGSSDWRGQGWPRYHGGGRQQFHHVRVSEFTMLSDWLYSADTEFGDKNQPESFSQEMQGRFQTAGRAYDSLLKSLSVARLSIVRGYEAPTWQTGRHNWSDDVCFVVVPPASLDVREVEKAARGLQNSVEVRVGKNRRVAIALSRK